MVRIRFGPPVGPGSVYRQFPEGEIGMGYIGPGRARREEPGGFMKTFGDIQTVLTSPLAGLAAYGIKSAAEGSGEQVPGGPVAGAQPEPQAQAAPAAGAPGAVFGGALGQRAAQPMPTMAQQPAQPMQMPARGMTASAQLEAVQRAQQEREALAQQEASMRLMGQMGGTGVQLASPREQPMELGPTPPIGAGAMAGEAIGQRAAEPLPSAAAPEPVQPITVEDKRRVQVLKDVLPDKNQPTEQQINDSFTEALLEVDESLSEQETVTLVQRTKGAGIEPGDAVALIQQGAYAVDEGLVARFARLTDAQRAAIAFQFGIEGRPLTSKEVASLFAAQPETSTWDDIAKIMRWNWPTKPKSNLLGLYAKGRASVPRPRQTKAQEALTEAQTELTRARTKREGIESGLAGPKAKSLIALRRARALKALRDKKRKSRMSVTRTKAGYRIVRPGSTEEMLYNQKNHGGFFQIIDQKGNIIDYNLWPNKYKTKSFALEQDRHFKSIRGKEDADERAGKGRLETVNRAVRGLTKRIDKATEQANKIHREISGKGGLKAQLAAAEADGAAARKRRGPVKAPNAQDDAYRKASGEMAAASRIARGLKEQIEDAEERLVSAKARASELEVMREEARANAAEFSESGSFIEPGFGLESEEE